MFIKGPANRKRPETQGENRSAYKHTARCRAYKTRGATRWILNKCSRNLRKHLPTFARKTGRHQSSSRGRRISRHYELSRSLVRSSVSTRDSPCLISAMRSHRNTEKSFFSRIGIDAEDDFVFSSRSISRTVSILMRRFAGCLRNAVHAVPSRGCRHG